MNFYTQYEQNPDNESKMEHPDPTLYIENTGVEPLKKTINRLMVAGMNLYDTNRGAYSVEDPDYDNKTMPYMTKYDDEKDVNMRMREINRRLRHKTRAEDTNPVVPEVNSETGVIIEPKEA